jgi:hypothetical protein
MSGAGLAFDCHSLSVVEGYYVLRDEVTDTTNIRIPTLPSPRSAVPAMLVDEAEGGCRPANLRREAFSTTNHRRSSSAPC